MKFEIINFIVFLVVLLTHGTPFLFTLCNSLRTPIKEEDEIRLVKEGTF